MAKPRKCRICKKSPVWRGGDVKNPGPFCKKCYHKHVWSQRPGARHDRPSAGGVDDSIFFENLPQPYTFCSCPDPHPAPYPDDDDWAWLCRQTRRE